MSIAEGFTILSAERIRQQGLEEEQGGGIATREPGLGRENGDVIFTASGHADWAFLAAAKFPGASMQLSEVLTEGLRVLRLGGIGDRHLMRLSGDGFLLRQRGLRWVFRYDSQHRAFIVHGIGQELLNPFRKIWRYFGQRKAIDLLETSELYLRRVDLLDDKFEARPTHPMAAAYSSALKYSLGEASPDHLRFYDNVRRSLFVCCWQKLETESREMWKTYCPADDGMVLQSTERQLQHEFVKMLKGRKLLFFRDITYIDHETHNPKFHGVPEQAFFKTKQFIEEREIRFAWWHCNCVSGTQKEIEAQLSVLPDNNRLPFDLVSATEQLVFNPSASKKDRQILIELIFEKHPALRNRIVRSAFETA